MYELQAVQVGYAFQQLPTKLPYNPYSERLILIDPQKVVQTKTQLLKNLWQQLTGISIAPSSRSCTGDGEHRQQIVIAGLQHKHCAVQMQLLHRGLAYGRHQGSLSGRFGKGCRCVCWQLAMLGHANGQPTYHADMTPVVKPLL